MWQSTLGDEGISFATGIRRENWKLRHSELNYFSQWGQGRRQIDDNYDFKAMSPDEQALNTLYVLKDSIKDMNNMLQTHSIESLLAGKMKAAKG